LEALQQARELRGVLDQSKLAKSAEEAVVLESYRDVLIDAVAAPPPVPEGD
jgi:hypothetical protein